MSTRRVSPDRLEELAFENRAPIDFGDTHAFLTIGRVTYVAELQVDE